jgi:ATP-dependent helicase/nuclease subunit A
VSLAQCLEEVLAETLYGEWLRAQPRGGQRAGNVTGFVQLAQQFDQFQRQGLYRFLKFIEAQQEAEAEPEVPAAATEDAVRLMSIHQSKGLEFSVVVLADLAKGFNEQDLRGEIVFDEEFGLCPKVKPPHVGGRYPSLPHWLAQRRQKRELRGEELRLLYVAVTRARDHLILSASIPEKQWDEKWVQPQAVTTQKIAAAKSFADWLALWFSGQAAGPGSLTPSRTAGALEDLQWRIVADEEAEGGADGVDEIGSGLSASGGEPAADGELSGLRARLEWTYPFAAATQRKAKSSVTALRREAEERDEEAEGLFPEAGAFEARTRRTRKTTLNAAEIGAAHHKFLEHVALEQVGDLVGEAERLVRGNHLSAEEAAVLDLGALAGFWNSPLGRKILAEPADVRREVPFTARFSPEELAQIVGAEAEPGLAGEFVIVQGVADLVVLRAEEIWVVDFKTDEVSARELAAKVKTYAPQLRLYASALEKVFGRTVTLRALHFFSIGRTEEV